MGKKGIQSKRSIGEIRDEPKTEQVIVLLTKTGKRQLNHLALSHRMSRSELIESIARGEFQLLPVKPKQFSPASQWRRLIFILNRLYISPKF
ncbi:MAG: hypothetical protein HC769_33080 [Cyanobacteria bacterium CRU_2_1]|nr:hypothetical protein [Cyanobacteria bacterium CRU_2_1]